MFWEWGRKARGPSPDLNPQPKNRSRERQKYIALKFIWKKIVVLEVWKKPVALSIN